ncbi:outer membrane beta-barrel protein [Deminuibacter soli]|uniref:PorT family protein n=1 Tax=Deminuibacter soli TaxID=2291815 RepID=A0A3E1NHC9_9BACT|nr:outer membrane beta-barrel protein [Deminuibacter soli]RFM27307.1 PorT family protein [Deminuibacter soli]
MKTMILLLVMLTGCCTMAGAQVLISLVFGKKLNTDKLEFGLMVAPGAVSLTGMNGKYKPALDLGLYFNFKVSENLFLHPEAIPKSAFGTKQLPVYATGNANIDTLFGNGYVQKNIKGISLPLLIHYRIKGLLFAELGPQVDWLLKTKDVFKTETNGNPLNYTINTNHSVTHFGIGAVAGLAYKLRKDKGLGIGIRYCFGMTDMIKNVSGSQRSQAWFCTISIPIGAGAAKNTTNTH